jgi:diguanylate cyclase (GGDEF)-like protein/PAS domain S-box-containing protein
LRRKREKHPPARPSQSQARLLQIIIDAIPAPIFYKDNAGIYLGCNVAFEQFIGLPREKVIGCTVYEVAPPELAEVYHQADLGLMRAGGTQIYEARVAGSDKVFRDVVFHKAVFIQQDGVSGGVVGTMLDITERKRAEAEVRHLASFDAMTGLASRQLFMARLEQSLEQARQKSESLVLFFLDLYRFKEVNDVLGHAGGDEALQAIGRRLVDLLGREDTLGRLAGDEFALFLPRCTAQEATVFAQQVLATLSSPLQVAGQEIMASASMGMALFPRDGENGESLLRHADMAMYEAKGQGRNTFLFYSEEMRRRLQARSELEAGLRRALQQQEFDLHYQPQWDLMSGRIVGAEALIRWRCPHGNDVPPDHFIQLAEETGLIHPLGEWVLRTACLQHRAWREQRLPPLRLAVNLSPLQFQRPGFIDMVDRLLEETGMLPGQLEFELTESSLMGDVSAAIALMVDLKVRGIQLAIDDFGTGYSSLAHLKHFPIDRLKIDRSFVRDVTSNPDDAAIVQAILAMAHKLNIEVLAEGVETAAQRDFLLFHHCREMQGFFLGRPMAADELAAQMALNSYFQGLKNSALVPVP